MELPIQIIDHQQVQPANSSTKIKPSAQTTSPGEKSFKSKFNKVLSSTEKPGPERTSQSEAETKTETETVKADGVVEQPTPTITPVIAPLMAILELVQEPKPDSGQEPKSMSMPVSSSENPVVPASGGKNVPQETGVGLVQFSNSVFNEVNTPTPVDTKTPADTQPIINTEPAANTQTAENPGKAADILPPEPKLFFDRDVPAQVPLNARTGKEASENNQFASQTATPGFNALPNTPVEAPPRLEQAVEQTGEKLNNGTVVPLPVAGAKEQMFDTGGSDSGSAENPSLLNMLGTVQTPKAPTPVIPFSPAETPPPVKEQVLQAIVQKARILSEGTQQQMQIQLKPEHLGPLNVQIAVENGAVTAKFQTDNPQVKQALEASFNQLKQDLQAQGFKVQHVAVSIGQQGMSFSEFSRRSPQFGLIKSKRPGKVEEVLGEQAAARASALENYGEIPMGGVDYKV